MFATLVLTAVLSLPELAPQAVAGQGLAVPHSGDTLWVETFDDGLDGWRMPYGQGAAFVPSGDPGRGNVLSLETGALPVYALIRGSEDWHSVRIEGQMLFPDAGDSYLGFIYRYVDDGRRIDFGSM